MGSIIILEMAQKLWNKVTPRQSEAHLIGHNHNLPVPQGNYVRIVFVVLQTHDLFDVLNFFVLHNLIVFGLADVKQFTTEWEDTEVISTDHSKSSNSEVFGGVTFC